MCDIWIKRCLRYKIVIENIIYVALVQFFGLLAPFITYPYLIEVLGLDLYGVVISAQILVSYATILIDFGSNSICAKNVSINRDNKQILSEILSAVLLVRLKIWFICLFFYLFLVLLIPVYREYVLLFALSYLMTTNELLFPQFFYQGLEKMKIISILNVLVKLLFILLIFLFVNKKSDYILVPVLYSIGYFISGVISLYILIRKYGVKLYKCNRSIQFYYVKECFPILATDLICTIKDKLNYLLVGMFVGMSDVVIYDLGLKLKELSSKPSNIISTVLLPRFAKNRNVKTFQHLLLFIIVMSVVLVCLVNIFMEPLVFFFLKQNVDLLPIRLFSIVPIILCPSILIANNFFISFGYHKYLFNSILVTTFVYIIVLFLFWIIGYLHSLYSFIFLALISFGVEFMYRMYIFFKKKSEIINNVVN